MLNPNPKLRVTTDDILKDPWMVKLSALCPASVAAQGGAANGMPKVTSSTTSLMKP